MTEIAELVLFAGWFILILIFGAVGICVGVVIAKARAANDDGASRPITG